MIFFSYFSIDATNTQGRLGKFVNDAPYRYDKCNTKMKLEYFDDIPRLCLYADRTINTDEEIRHDYGDNEMNLSWREPVNILIGHVCELKCHLFIVVVYLLLLHLSDKEKKTSAKN